VLDVIQGNNKLKQQEAIQNQEANNSQQNMIITPPNPIATQSSQQQIHDNISNIIPNTAPGMSNTQANVGMQNNNQMMSGNNGGLLAANEALGGFGSAW
jgi:hypothetical protein